MLDLTVDDVHAFVESINKGRVAAGLDPVTRIEFDESEPGHTGNCLSARHLFKPALDAAVYSTTVAAPPVTNRETLRSVAEALDTHVGPQRRLTIPPAILKVTNVFDKIASDRYYLDDRLNERLRSLFVEAGYVD